MEFQDEVSRTLREEEVIEILPVNDFDWDLLIETDDQRAIRRHWFKQTDSGLERFVGVHSHSIWSSTWNHHP
jgi:hypothetical protein